MHMKCPSAARDHLCESLFGDTFAMRYGGVHDLTPAICSRVNISSCESGGWERTDQQLNTGTILLWFQKFSRSTESFRKPHRLCWTQTWLSSRTLNYKHHKWVTRRELFTRIKSIRVYKITQMQKRCIIYLLIAPLKNYDFSPPPL